MILGLTFTDFKFPDRISEKVIQGTYFSRNIKTSENHRSRFSLALKLKTLDQKFNSRIENEYSKIRKIS